MLKEAGFTTASHALSCYVLIGYKNGSFIDTFEKAEKRLIDTMKAGFVPFAMLYRDKLGRANPEWEPFQRLWSRPAIIASRFPQYLKADKKVINQ